MPDTYLAVQTEYIIYCVIAISLPWFRAFSPSFSFFSILGSPISPQIYSLNTTLCNEPIRAEFSLDFFQARKLRMERHHYYEMRSRPDMQCVCLCVRGFVLLSLRTSLSSALISWDEYLVSVALRGRSRARANSSCMSVIRTSWMQKVVGVKLVSPRPE